MTICVACGLVTRTPNPTPNPNPYPNPNPSPNPNPNQAGGLLVFSEVSFWTLHLDPLLSIVLGVVRACFFFEPQPRPNPNPNSHPNP